MNRPALLPALLLFLPLTASAETVREAYPPPGNATRLEARDPFGDWLGTLSLAPPEAPVRTHDGRVVPQDARVVELPVVRGDLQQCADTAMRLRAEWQRDTGQPVAFHATSGDLVPWSRWAAGERPRAQGNKLVWSAKAAALPADPARASEADWERYLQSVFMWAGTASLVAHDTVAVAAPLPGDVIVEAGFPGHAVVVLDAAQDAAGTTYVLVGEGFMPAQDMHVQHGPFEDWWRWDAQTGLDLGYWQLGADAVRTWKR